VIAGGIVVGAAIIIDAVTSDNEASKFTAETVPSP
jgi:hypothetical protein